MLLYHVKDVVLKFYQDDVARIVVLVIFALSIVFGSYISSILGLTILLFFINGCAAAVFTLNHKDGVGRYLQKLKDFFGYKDYDAHSTLECNVCGNEKCPRHNRNLLIHEPWRGFFIDPSLDDAVDKFFSHILNGFICNWYAQISPDEEFILSIKSNLRDALCRLLIRAKELDAPTVITTRLLPTFFIHYEIIAKMLLIDHVPMDRLAKTFLIDEYPIHPAVLSRQAELSYLRGVAKVMIPRLFTQENIKCKIFSNLIKELLTFWVLLPLLDVISDPNLINLLIIAATDKRNSETKKGGRFKVVSCEKVEILKDFVDRSREKVECGLETVIGEENILKDQNKLYYFMQFLIKEGAVELLRFYLDVDILNKELEDPHITTDPTKLSSLHQQSEKLLQIYQTTMRNEQESSIATTLNEAHERVKEKLEEKWRKQFSKTSEYFELVYGSREVKETLEKKISEGGGGSGTKLSSKFKEVIRGAVDGAPIEATEAPTVWDALNDTQPSNNIYSSVTQKLRKEKGQSLDSFMAAFMHSIEQSPDIGEDVIQIKDKVKKKFKQPGQSVVFGDLFELKKASKNTHTTTLLSHSVRGPSQCLIYILVKILNAPVLVVRLALAFCCVSRKTVDTLIHTGVARLLRAGLKETRLAVLINLLREIIFLKKLPEPTPAELLRRQQEARKRLENLRPGLGNVADVLQSPVLNKHLMYCLFDIVLGEMYPEFESPAAVTTSAFDSGFGPGRQDWGLANVRQGAHMFWWLYYVTDPSVKHYTDRPIVIWFQGGPGASSSGYGNFEEIGPLDLDLHERAHTWVKHCNILFIDNPVGSGFSYVDDLTLLAKNNDQIAQDLVTLMKQFYRLFPEFRETPLHIFSESYGGKMAVEFAYQLDRAIKEGLIECNLGSVALGAPWISPEDSVLSWGSFLLNLGFVDTKGYSVIQKAAEGIQHLIRVNKTIAATEIWKSMQQLVTNETVGIDCYNVMTPQKFISQALVKHDEEILEFSEDTDLSFRIARSLDSTDRLELLMRGPVAASLGIPKRALWGSQKDQVFEALYEDFMKPATRTVELLLNNTNVNIIIYTGQLDLVVCTPGTVRWVEKLQWPGRVEYQDAPRTGLGYLGVLEGYEKGYDRLSMYWINRAGHMAPVDNHMAMQYILDKHVLA